MEFTQCLSSTLCENPIRWQLSAWRNNQQLFANESTRGTTVEVIECRLTTLLGHIANSASSQRPVRVSRTPTPTLQLARLIQIANKCRRRR